MFGCYCWELWFSKFVVGYWFDVIGVGVVMYSCNFVMKNSLRIIVYIVNNFYFIVELNKGYRMKYFFKDI